MLYFCIHLVSPHSSEEPAKLQENELAAAASHVLRIANQGPSSAEFLPLPPNHSQAEISELCIGMKGRGMLVWNNLQAWAVLK